MISVSLAKINKNPRIHKKYGEFLNNDDILVYFFYERKPSKAPAATAEPMTPATFGPMACMSRKL